MTQRTDVARPAAAIRDLDPAPAAPLTADERVRADALRDRILASSVPAAAPRRARLLVPAGLLAAAAVAVPIALSGGSAFASWTAAPAPLPPAAASEAADTCRSALDVQDVELQRAMGERRGGWAFVRIDGPGGEAACLMPEDLVGTDVGADRGSGFFGSFDPDPPETPTPDPDGIVETESMTGSVSLPGRIPLTTVEGWFTWTNGYAGRDVAAVTVHPPVGPDVEASLADGRFTAWWPAGEARGDHPGIGEAWSYSLTLVDGTVREVAAEH